MTSGDLDRAVDIEHVLGEIQARSGNEPDVDDIDPAAGESMDQSGGKGRATQPGIATDNNSRITGLPSLAEHGCDRASEMLGEVGGYLHVLAIAFESDSADVILPEHPRWDRVLSGTAFHDGRF